MWLMVTDRKVKRDKPPIILKDCIHKVVFWGRKLQNIPLVSENKKQAITLQVDTLLTKQCHLVRNYLRCDKKDT